MTNVNINKELALFLPLPTEYPRFEELEQHVIIFVIVALNKNARLKVSPSNSKTFTMNSFISPLINEFS